MTALSIFLVGVLCAIATSGQTAFDLFPRPGVCGANLADRIIGGQITPINAYPWTALLVLQKSPNQISFLCGGSLISMQFVLSAAHCFISPVDKHLHPINNLLVRLGEWDILNEVDCNGNICADKPLDVPLENYRLHEHFYPHIRRHINDIALVKLKFSVNFTKFISPVCLPLTEELQRLQYGRTFTVIGWGDTEKGSEKPDILGSRFKKQTIAHEVDTATCANLFPSFWQSVICTAWAPSRIAPGDSGGPLVAAEKDAFWYQYGIVVGQEFWYGTFTRVSSFLPWIAKNMQAMSFASVPVPTNLSG